ncbi:MAG: menaquinone biosynthesis decarboxylase [Dehalococcoidia bacterium]|nr:menaquinone biosynthesis decarboxylase [Dehalococcoidia bacterium]
MSFHNLREFIAYLEKKGELQRVQVPISRDLEISEVTDRVSKSAAGNVALLFENVEGFSIPLLINAFGSARRMAWALGVEDLDEPGQRLAKLTSLEGIERKGLVNRVKQLGQARDLVRFGPETVKKAPCQEVVTTQNPSLSMLPVMKCWPDDGGRFITMPLVITRDPLTGRRNVGTYRLQVFDDQTTGLHWHLHKGAAQHHRSSQELGRRLEIAVALGADPALTYSSTAPLPPDLDEVLLAGWLARRKIEMVKGITVDLEVPAQAEIVLEGYMDPEERRLEGPFGDHTGFYSLPDQYPVFHLTAITHRRNPIYQATLVGRPPMEDYYMGKATERLFLPLIKLVLPEIVDVSMPWQGVFHNMVLVSIKKTYPGQGRKVISALWGLMLLMLSKLIVVVEEDVDVQNLDEVLWWMCNNFDARRDLVVMDGPLDDLDHSSPAPHYGAKLAIDATRKTAEEGHTRPWPNAITMDPTTKALIDKKWSSLGLRR